MTFGNLDISEPGRDNGLSCCAVREAVLMQFDGRTYFPGEPRSAAKIGAVQNSRNFSPQNFTQSWPSVGGCLPTCRSVVLTAPDKQRATSRGRSRPFCPTAAISRADKEPLPNWARRSDVGFWMLLEPWGPRGEGVGMRILIESVSWYRCCQRLRYSSGVCFLGTRHGHVAFIASGSDCCSRRVYAF